MSATPELMEASLKMIAGLLVVLGALFALWHVSRKVSAGGGKSRESKRIRVLASQCIGLKKHISLVQVPGAVLVLGVTNDRINCLATLPEEDWPEDDAALAGRGTVLSFMSQLKNEVTGISRKAQDGAQPV